MDNEQLKSILDEQFNAIVVERFDIRKIRETIKELRIKMTNHFRKGQDALAKIVAKAINDLLHEVNGHHEEIVLKMA